MNNSLFVPAEGKTTAVTASTSATSAVEIPYDCNAVAIANSSATAIGFVRVTYYDSITDTMTGAAPTATADIPILPGQHIVRYVQKGKHKVIRTISSAADGTLYITPGSAV